jgi:hypothetical protein
VIANGWCANKKRENKSARFVEFSQVSPSLHHLPFQPHRQHNQVESVESTMNITTPCRNGANCTYKNCKFLHPNIAMQKQVIAAAAVNAQAVAMPQQQQQQQQQVAAIQQQQQVVTQHQQILQAV